MLDLMDRVILSLRALDFMFTALAVVVWVLLAVVAGMLAEMKGRAGWGFFLLALLLSPLLGLMFVAGVGDRRAAELKALRRELEEMRNEVYRRGSAG